MTIELIPVVPNICMQQFLKKYLQNTEYDAYAIGEDFEIIKGRGKIASNNAYNYHNNYDDSELTVWFREVDGEFSRQWQMNVWWTDSLEEIKAIHKKVVSEAISRLDKIREDLYLHS